MRIHAFVWAVPALTLVSPVFAEIISSAGLAELGYYKYWRVSAPVSGQVEDVALVDENLYLMTADSRVFAIHADTGALRWSTRAGGPGDKVFEPAHTRSFWGRDVVMITTSRKLRILDRSNGDVLADIQPDFVPCAGGVSDGQRLFVPGLDRMLHCLELVPRPQAVVVTKRWRIMTGGLTRAAPVLWGGGLFFVSDDGRLRACYAVDKERLWVFATNAAIRARPHVDGTGVYFGGTDNLIYKLDVETGRYAWPYKRTQVPGRITVSPAIIGERLFQAVDNHGVFAIDTNSGDRLWMVEEAVGFISASERRVHLLSRTGDILAVDPQTGDVKSRGSTAGFLNFVSNTRSSAMYIADSSGTVMCAQEKHVPYLRFEDVQSAARGD